MKREPDTSDLLRQAPPNAPEAEAAVLGSIILDPRCLAEVSEILGNNEAFYRQEHAAIYDVLVELGDEDNPLDMVHITQRLHDKLLLKGVGGVDGLLEIAECVPSASSANYYARIVADKARLRRTLEALREGIASVYNANGDAAEVIDQIERSVYDVAHESSERTELLGADDVLGNSIQRIERRVKTGDCGLPTGLDDLDRLAGKLQDSELTILAARPSIGKTALALNIALHAALVQRRPTAFFSVEMSAEAVGERLLSAHGCLDSMRLRDGKLSANEWQSVNFSRQQVGESPLFVDGTSSLTLLQLRARARRLKASEGLQFIVIDYLQRMDTPKSESRQQAIAELTRGIKSLAMELNVPVLCLSQLNRSSTMRTDHKPKLSDLRESGEIEQEADVVWLLHREAYYHQDDRRWMAENPQKVNAGELIVAKNRNGQTGMVNLHWAGEWGRFTCLHRESESVF